MEDIILFHVLGIIATLTPVYVLLAFGPETTKRRLFYSLVGLTTASFIGLILYLISIDDLLGLENNFERLLARGAVAAIVEELIRYPGILAAVYLADHYKLELDEETRQLSESKYVEGKFTTIPDPHGMGMFFGTGYGLGETFAFYIFPTIQELIAGDPIFPVGEEITQIFYRITAVIAHISLTYLAMAITSQKGFWRVSILLHLAANVSNSLFTELAANYSSTIVFTVFTRFAIALIAYFLLRPKVRYLTPAVLLFLLVSLFLFVILIATFIALLVGIMTLNFPIPF